jgi:hypothetical protein
MPETAKSAMNPLVLLGETRSLRNIELLRSKGWGRMFVVNRPTPYEGEPWGFDNGAFVCWQKQVPWDARDFQRRLDDAIVLPRPYIAVTPDIVAGGLHSLDFSLRWLPNLPKSWPWYLAVQDDMAVEDIRSVVGRFHGIFLGGSNKFKATAYRWRTLAHSLGLKFHYGRAGTPKKMRSAYKVKADSLDSAFPLWSNERLASFTAAWDCLQTQHVFKGFYS